MDEIEIGAFTLSKTKGGITITRNAKSALEGEGGEFNEAALEKVIEGFYDEHF